MGVCVSRKTKSLSRAYNVCVTGPRSLYNIEGKLSNLHLCNIQLGQRAEREPHAWVPTARGSAGVDMSEAFSRHDRDLRTGESEITRLASSPAVVVSSMEQRGLLRRASVTEWFLRDGDISIAATSFVSTLACVINISILIGYNIYPILWFLSLWNLGAESTYCGFRHGNGEPPSHNSRLGSLPGSVQLFRHSTATYHSRPNGACPNFLRDPSGQSGFVRGWASIVGWCFLSP